VAGLVPPELGPILPVFPRHETRLLNRLPGIGIDVPAIQYLEVAATTGTAGIVTEGSAKPELTMPATPQVATARKIAAHTGISWEAYSGDYPAFVNAVQVDLLKSVVDAENLQLWGGTGEANGQVTNPNVLTFDASTVTTTPGPWDALEHGIEALRSGPALAECDLILMHPSTWSAVRRQTNTYGNYYVAADPSSDEVNSAWGVDVLVSTQFTAGTAVLLDTSFYGRAVIRESLVTRIGFSGTDFTDNLIRFVSEERLMQTIERPQAICKITGLPTAAPSLAETKSTAKR
jgi:HK97 family phage major capsid protein